MYFKKIFEQTLKKVHYNYVEIILKSKYVMSKKEQEFHDDIVELQDRYETELEEEEYQNIKITFKNGEFKIKTEKYFDEFLSKRNIENLIKKEIPTDLKLISFQIKTIKD